MKACGLSELRPIKWKFGTWKNIHMVSTLQEKDS